MSVIEVIDFFCGIGGMSKGLEMAGLNVIRGYDIDPHCEIPYVSNNSGLFFQEDIRSLDFSLESGTDSGFSEDAVKVVVGGPPCQPFSRFVRRNGVKEGDERLGLIGEFKRVSLELDADVIVMENVPSLRESSVFLSVLDGLKDAGYHLWYGVIRAEDYGVPQRRHRLIMLASRLGDISLSVPAGVGAGESVRKAIGNLPSLDAGESCDDDPCHVAPNHGAMTLRRLVATPEGGGWSDWDESLRLACHRRESGKAFKHVYSRMSWDKVAPTITGSTGNFGSGRFGHPFQNRVITPREASNLQSFPTDYRYITEDNRDSYSVTRLRQHIGNAVPPLLARAVGLSVLSHVSENVSVYT